MNKPDKKIIKQVEKLLAQPNLDDVCSRYN